ADPAIWKVPGAASDTVRVQFDSLAANTTAADELGYYVATTALGRVGTLIPSDPGYAQAVVAAIGSGSGGVVFAQGSQPGGVAWADLPVGSYIGVYLVVNGTTADVLSGYPATSPEILFSPAGA